MLFLFVKVVIFDSDFLLVLFFFFKQKTAYEMRISDWSSDVCSSDLDWPAFTVWLSALLHCHGDRILRVKGKLYAASTGKPLIIHGVQHLMYPPVHLEAEPDDDRHSWLVFITSGLARPEITESLDLFLRHAPTPVVDLPGHRRASWRGEVV